jgi:hypothetical protein
VATSSYATTGQLAFALEGKAPVVQLNERTRYLNLPPVPASVLQCPALYVELERRASPSLLRDRFRSVSFITNVVRKNRGTPLATYPVYLAADPIAESLLTP